MTPLPNVLELAQEIYIKLIVCERNAPYKAGVGASLTGRELVGDSDLKEYAKDAIHAAKVFDEVWEASSRNTNAI